MAYKFRSWPTSWKARANRITKRVIGRRVFELSYQDIHADPPAWQLKIESRWQDIYRDTNLPYAIILFLICLTVTILWKMAQPALLPELWPEMGGMTFDVFFILIVFAFFEHRRARAQFIERQHEMIDDYKRWDHEEAHIRMTGAIRRLNKIGIFAIDFTGAKITALSFAKNGIGSIADSQFYDGTWGRPTRETGIALTHVEFDHVDCTGVLFSPHDPLAALSPTMLRYANLRDCTFVDADLQKAKFNGALLEWTSPPPASLYEVVDQDEDGTPHYVQSTYAPFDQANLSDASFRRCRFVNADFRNATGLDRADFLWATGLDFAEFDDQETKDMVLANANRLQDAT